MFLICVVLHYCAERAATCTMRATRASHASHYSLCEAQALPAGSRRARITQLINKSFVRAEKNGKSKFVDNTDDHWFLDEWQHTKEKYIDKRQQGASHASRS